MASRSKKKTTFAKLNREQKLRERQQEKLARKEARKAAALLEPEPEPTTIDPLEDEGVTEDEETETEAAA